MKKCLLQATLHMKPDPLRLTFEVGQEEPVVVTLKSPLVITDFDNFQMLSTLVYVV